MNERQAQINDTLPQSHNFAKNSLFNLIGFIVTFPILIVLTPYVLKVLGNAQFGIWAIAGVITSYAQLSDLGMTTAIVKYVAEHWAKKNVARVNEVVSTAFFSFAVAGGLVVACFLIAGNFLVTDILKVPEELQDEALFVLSGVLLIFYANLLFSVYNSIILGLQRMDVSNGIMIVSKVLRALGMFVFLSEGMGLKGLIFNSAICSFIAIAANVFSASKLLHGLRISPFLFSLSELRGIAKYSANIFAAKLLGLFQDPINKLILVSFTSLTMVSFYEIGFRLTLMVRQFFQIALMPLLPASSELHGRDNKHDLTKLYFDVSRMLYLFAVPIFLLIILLAEPLVQIWLGEGYKLVAYAMQLLLIGHLFSLLVTPQYVILQGIGNPGINTIAHILAAVINVTLAIVLISFMGFAGSLIAISISLILSSLYIDCLFRKKFGIELKTYLRKISVLRIFGASVICGWLFFIFKNVNLWGPGKVIYFTIGFFFIYFTILKIWNVTNRKDSQLLRKILKLARSES